MTRLPLCCGALGTHWSPPPPARVPAPVPASAALPRPATPSLATGKRSGPLDPTVWSASAGSLTDPEHLRGCLREDVAQEIEECPAGVPGPEPGLYENCAALHLPSFLIHAETQSWPHAREIHPTWAGSQPHPPWMLPGCCTPRALCSQESEIQGTRVGTGRSGFVRLSCLGLSAPVLSPSLLALLLHGPQTSKNQQDPAPGAQKPAEESCYLDLLERLPHSSSGQMKKWWVGEWVEGAGCSEERRGSGEEDTQGEREVGELVQGSDQAA